MLSLYQLIRLVEGPLFPRPGQGAPKPEAPAAADPAPTPAPAASPVKTFFPRRQTVVLPPNQKEVDAAHVYGTRGLSNRLNPDPAGMDRRLLTPLDRQRGYAIDDPKEADVQPMASTEAMLSGDPLTKKVLEFMNTNPNTFPEGREFSIGELVTALKYGLGKVTDNSYDDAHEHYGAGIEKAIRVLSGQEPLAVSPKNDRAPYYLPSKRQALMPVGQQKYRRINAPGGVVSDPNEDERVFSKSRYTNPAMEKAKSIGVGSPRPGSLPPEAAPTDGDEAGSQGPGVNPQEVSMQDLHTQYNQARQDFENAYYQWENDGKKAPVHRAWVALEKAVKPIAGRFDEFDPDTQKDVKDMFHAAKNLHHEIMSAPDGPPQQHQGQPSGEEDVPF